MTLLLAAGLAFGAGQGEGDTIKIGVAGAHSGDLASYGLPTVNAAELVVQKVNEEGGINGKMIELVIEDDQCLPEVAANTAAKLVSEGVVAVIGHICSGATNTALPIYLEEEIVVISPSATNPGLAEFDNFFRTIATDEIQARQQVDFLVNEIGVERVAVLHDKGDYGKGLADFAADFLTDNGVDVALYEGVTVGAVDYSAIINRVSAEDVDAVVFGGYHPEASKLVGQGRRSGLAIPFISGDGVKDDTFIDVAGEAAEGVYATGPRDTSDNPMDAQAKGEHIEAYDTEPGPFFMNAYSATLALLEAIRTAGSTDYAEVTAALKGQFVDTPLGSISFAENGDPIGVGFSVYQVREVDDELQYVQVIE
jgi:branched-chain amino acid transport system substrate-binding protein